MDSLMHYHLETVYRLYVYTHICIYKHIFLNKIFPCSWIWFIRAKLLMDSRAPTMHICVT